MLRLLKRLLLLFYSLDLGDVELLLIYVGMPKDTFALEIDNIRLQ